eukprot:gene1376-1579_t
MLSIHPWNIDMENQNYTAEGNCGLEFHLPCQIFISPDPSLQGLSLIDCNKQASFISRVRSSLLLSNLHIRNGITSCINVPPNSDSFVVFLTTMIFENCQGSNGGAVQVSYPNTLSIHNSTFIGNSATDAGGAIYAYSLYVFDATFQRNSAARGGAIFSNTDAEVIGSHFYLNDANAGGAVYTTNFQAYQSIFDDNYGLYGGAICTVSMNLDDCHFEQNRGRYGGAIYLHAAHSENFMTYSTLINNTATLDGGAMYINNPSPNGNLTLNEHTRVTNNHAIDGDGGAVYFNNTFQGFIFYGSFVDNLSSDPKTDEFGCDQGAEGYNCNLCSTSSCQACTNIEGGICVQQGNETLCMASTYQCVYGACSVNHTKSITCTCESGYFGAACNETAPTPTPTMPPNSDSSDTAADKRRTRALIISMPIMFGFLLIVFLVVIYLMVKKKQQTGSGSCFTALGVFSGEVRGNALKCAKPSG